MNLDELVKQLPVGLVITGDHGAIIYHNDLAFNMIAGQHETLIGCPICQVIPESNIIKTIKKAQPSLSLANSNKKNLKILYEYPIESDGQKAGVTLLFHSSFVEHMAYFVDKINEMKQELQLIMSLVGELVTITDQKGTILKVNEACERMMGVAKKDFIGKPMEFLEKEKIVSHSSTKQVIKEGRKITMTQTTKSGRRLLVTGHPIFNEEGKLTKVINISKDITETDLISKELQETKKLIDYYESELTKKERNGQKPLIKSQQLKAVYDLAERIQDLDSTVLLLGEAGVGKRTLATYIHSTSKVRKSHPFVEINCGTIPEALIEAELFGQVETTGEGKQVIRQGCIREADQGTLFLNDIDELSLPVQVKLLKVLEEKKVTPIGGTAAVDVDVRIIAATEQDLEERVRAHRFRRELYYLINTVPIIIPPLRERKEELPFFIQSFLEHYNRKYHYAKKLDKEVIRAFLKNDWAGNIRELQNVIETVVVTSADDEITFDQLPDKIKNATFTNEELSGHTLKTAVEEFEKHVIEKTLKRSRTLKEASIVLGIDASTLTRKVQKFKLKIAESQ
ncbi:sigma 54-interacting transcriptional regulator [Alkalihalobacillus oceani]|uniref:sigma 54-interacting transcriptional regulator n=1 Tax=Halalkalibacter oceani TaxID=1653776 RepID=UPI0020421F15|nr:sigma 54-interacting transcriptional regulator [Halalkalibacter oceani]